MSDAHRDRGVHGDGRQNEPGSVALAWFICLVHLPAAESERLDNSFFYKYDTYMDIQ